MVVTVAKGYDLGYIWKTQGQASAEHTPGGYYINAAQAGEPPGRWWGPGAKLHDEIKAGVWTPATYTVRQCVMDWLGSLELDPHTMATYRGQAEKWIYPKIGAKKLAEFKAADADRFFRASPECSARPV